jgi:ABC-type multidrug transport system ATPase subunit
VLLTTQYLEEADRLAERIAVVDDGKIIANDTPERLKAQLGSTVVEMGVKGEGNAERAVALLSGRFEGHVEREGDIVRITSDEGAHVLIDVLRTLDGDNLSPDTLAVREPSMDDVFLALTGHKAEQATEDDEAVVLAGRRGRRQR